MPYPTVYSLVTDVRLEFIEFQHRQDPAVLRHFDGQLREVLEVRDRVFNLQNKVHFLRSRAKGGQSVFVTGALDAVSACDPERLTRLASELHKERTDVWRCLLVLELQLAHLDRSLAYLSDQIQLIRRDLARDLDVLREQGWTEAAVGAAMHNVVTAERFADETKGLLESAQLEIEAASEPGWRRFAEADFRKPLEQRHRPSGRTKRC